MKGSVDINQPDALDKWQSSVGGLPPIPSPASHKQRAWDTPVAEFIADELIASSTDMGTAPRLRAVRSKGAGNGLQALPLSNIGLKLDNMAVTIAVSLRLGAPLVQAHTCPCGAAVESDGHHGLS